MKEQFEILYSQYYSLVYQMCLGYMKGDGDLAKDMLQEVFINIWNALPKFRKESSEKTWIYRITVNTCLLYIRDNKKRVTTSLEEVHPQAEEHNTTSEEQYTQLYKAIGCLPELDRLIVMLVLEELEYNEIAKITGINAINLRVKIHRIKKKMSELLKLETEHG